MKSPLQRPRLHDALIVATAFLATTWFVVVGGGGFPLDDAWIHQTYARNLASTGQWTFVGGVPSAASTAPLYTVLVSLAYRLGILYPLWTHGLGALALAVTGLLGRRIALRAAPGRMWTALAAGLAAVLSWHLVWAAASGMDTALFAMWTLALIWLTWREMDARWPAGLLRAVVFGAVAGLATLTRPEAILLTGLCGMALLAARPGRTLRAMFLWLALAAITWLIVMLPYFVLNLQVVGGLLPSTNAAKVTEFAANRALPIVERVFRLMASVMAGAHFLLIPGWAVFALRMIGRVRRDRSAWPPLVGVVWVVALPLLYAFWLPFWGQHGRYVIPILPAFVVLGVVGTGWLLDSARTRPVSRIAASTLAISSAALLLVFATLTGPTAYQRDVWVINEEMVDPAVWIANHLPVDAPLAAHDIGAIGYFAPRSLLDTAGLISPEFIPYFYQEDATWRLFRERGIEYLMAFADQTPGRRTDDARLCPIYQSAGTTAVQSGGSKMVIYRLAYEGICVDEI